MMRINKYIKILLGLFFLIGSSIFVTSFNGKQEKKKWKLVWTENFNGKSLNKEVWGYMGRGRDDSRKYHSSNPACYAFKNGKLILKGIKNPDLSLDTAKYLTGGITTQNKKAFTPPCKIEIRARINSAQGAWPAFWMMPFKNVNGWPKDGEIDIMEHLNFDDYVYQTVHSAYTKADRNAKPLRFVTPKVDMTKFNTYGVEITSDRVVFTINGVETLNYPNIKELEDKDQFPFFHDWYLMLDMQLGGSWVGKITPSDLPVEMEIDWVRYFRIK